MAIVDPQDTLSYHQSRVLTTARDMSHIPTHLVAAKISNFLESDTQKNTSPDREAVTFYAMNHGMSLIQQTYAAMEPLSPEDLQFVEAYHATLAPMAVRAFYYLVVICNREARHNSSLLNDLPKIKNLFGPTLASWMQKAGGGEGGIHKSLLNNAPNAPIGQFVDMLCWTFYNSSWPGGYGGKAWGAVNDCLCRFVKGEFTAEMMLDTNWTLAHNGGPIFNKGHCYGMYTETLKRILDVQRAGQVPEAVLSDPSISKFASPEVQKWVTWMKKRFEGKIGNFVDWFAVEALGSVAKYPTEKNQQLAAHGPSEYSANAAKMAQEAAAKKAAADAIKKAEMAKKYLEILPGVQVEKVTKIRKAA